MQEREVRERCPRRYQNCSQRLFSKTGLQIVERDCAGNGKPPNSCATKFCQMSADLQSLAKVFCQGPHISAGRTNHAHVEVKRSIEIVLHQLTIGSKWRELVNAHTDRLSLNLFTSAGEFIQLSAFYLLCGIHRRNLIDVTAKTC